MDSRSAFCSFRHLEKESAVLVLRHQLECHHDDRGHHGHRVLFYRVKDAESSGGADSG